MKKLVNYLFVTLIAPLIQAITEQSEKQSELYGKHKEENDKAESARHEQLIAKSSCVIVTDRGLVNLAGISFINITTAYISGAIVKDINAVEVTDLIKGYIHLELSYNHKDTAIIKLDMRRVHEVYPEIAETLLKKINSQEPIMERIENRFKIVFAHLTRQESVVTQATIISMYLQVMNELISEDIKKRTDAEQALKDSGTIPVQHGSLPLETEQA